MTSVLVIDDHPVVLQGCRMFLEDAGIEDVLQSSTLAEGFRLYRKHRPDLIFLDLAICTGALGGLSFLERLRVHDRHTPVLVFSMHADPMIVSRALSLGANGYLLKDTWDEEFLAAFRRVRDGGMYISHELACELAVLGLRGNGNPLQALTLREFQVLELIVEGKPYNFVAGQMNVSYKTVSNTVASMKAKLGAQTLLELVSIANQYLPSASSFGERLPAKQMMSGESSPTEA